MLTSGTFARARVVEVRQPVAEARAEVQQRRRRLVGHPRVAVGRAGRDTLEQRQHRAHLGHRVERGDEMHLRRAGVREARGHAGVDERADQGLGSVHGARIIAREMLPGMDPRTPVIVGAAQVTRDAGDDSPIALAVEAAAARGTGQRRGDALLRKADSCRHVATLCWPYTDEAALIASELGISPRETVRTTPLGGDGPQRLLGDTARAIAAGEVEIAVITGAEALAALRGNQQAGAKPDWPMQPSEPAPTRTVGTDRFASNEAEAAVGLLAPVYNYALLESAVRARQGQDRRDPWPPDGHAVVALLKGRRGESACADPTAVRARRAARRDPRQPSCLAPLPEAADRQPPGRPGDCG